MRPRRGLIVVEQPVREKPLFQIEPDDTSFQWLDRFGSASRYNFARRDRNDIDRNPRLPIESCEKEGASSANDRACR